MKVVFLHTTSMATKEAARGWAMEQDVGRDVNGVRAFHNRRDLSSFANQWDRPLIGISGASDVAPPPSVLRQITTGGRRSLHLMPESGHYVNIEQPSAFDALLTEVIRPFERSLN